MPKLKTHSGAKKRFKLTKNGKVLCSQAYKSHILTKKTTKRKRKNTLAHKNEHDAKREDESSKSTWNKC